MVEEVLNLALGECPLIWPGLVLLDVLGSVPVEEDLRWMGAEQLLADAVPAVVGIADV